MQFKNIQATMLCIVLTSLVGCSDSSEPAADAKPEMALADWVLINGQILTVDADFGITQAMAVKDGL